MFTSLFLSVSLALPNPLAEQAYLGVELADVAGPGVRVTRVVDGTAAKRANLLKDDLLLAIDEAEATSVAQLIQVLRSHQPGDEIRLKFQRDSMVQHRTIALGRRTTRDTGNAERAREVLRFLQLKPGDLVADIGCGSGWLSAEVAEAVGPRGHVFAAELQSSNVEKVSKRGLANVTALLSRSGDVSLPAGMLDVVFLHDVASHVSNAKRRPFYASIARALKKDGSLVIFGRHGKAREMLAEFRSFGFVPVSEADLGELGDSDLDDRFWAGIRFRFVPPEF